MDQVREIASRLAEDEPFKDELWKVRRDPAGLVMLMRRTFPAATYEDIADAFRLAETVLRLDLAEEEA